MPKQGNGQGQGRGVRDGSGGGRGRGCVERMGGGGSCLCPKCGLRVPHAAGRPCLQERCPECGAAMVREGSPHHREIESRRAARETTG